MLSAPPPASDQPPGLSRGNAFGSAPGCFQQANIRTWNAERSLDDIPGGADIPDWNVGRTIAWQLAPSPLESSTVPRCFVAQISTLSERG
jgi:hypothetical protein